MSELMLIAKSDLDTKQADLSRHVNARYIKQWRGGMQGVDRKYGPLWHMFPYRLAEWTAGERVLGVREQPLRRVDALV